MTRSSGFTLIELLVVVALIGIISAIGTISYQGYVSGAKKSSANNSILALNNKFGKFSGGSSLKCCTVVRKYGVSVMLDGRRTTSGVGFKLMTF